MLVWRLPLGFPPSIALTGRGRHGAEPVERFRLPHLWCVHLYEYEAELRLNGEAYRLHPGAASIIAPNVEMEYRFRGVSEHLYAHFAVPDAGRRAVVTVPALQDVGAEFAGLYAAFEDVPRWAATQPDRAAARLWDILWRLADRREPPAVPDAAAAVARVRELVEIHLAEPLYVGDLARQVGFSQNHLTRLFCARMGMTVVDYIRQRRVERARHLLGQSTLPVKAIAAAVGIPDLHLFNKVIRRACGKPPRALRG